jgi:hypothetical protein
MRKASGELNGRFVELEREGYVGDLEDGVADLHWSHFSGKDGNRLTNRSIDRPN